ncbi:cation transporter [Paucidesulfovibrio longus]|uniref:cation transporter n=1 Tax=Paucidesulfovibrio longus TaxID=889 RepID=UPI0003B5C83C|nr:cation transporter [Paucidesulfovibrio longus]
MQTNSYTEHAKENLPLQFKVLKLSLLIDVFSCLPVVAIAILSNSMILFTDIYDYSYNIISGIISVTIVNKLIKGKITSYDYGSGKLESMGSLVISALVIMGLISTAALSIHRIYYPQSLNIDFSLIGFAINFIALIINIILWLRVQKIAAVSNSPIMKSQWRLHRANAIVNMFVFISLLAAILFRDFSWGFIIDPVCAILLVFAAGYAFVGLIKESLNDLLDKTLDEDLQMKILRRLAEHHDWYDSFHSVKSRKSGKKIIIDITLGFTPAKTAGEMFELTGRLKEKLENDIPDSEVQIISRIDKEFDETNIARKSLSKIRILPITEADLTDSMELARRYLPSDNPELILNVLKESCMLGTNSEELLKENIVNPRYWVALSDDKLIGFSGYYFYSHEPDSVWAGWATVDLRLGLLSARAANNLFTKVAYEARKTGRKYIRLCTSALPEEAMANKIHSKFGFEIYKTDIDWDGVELLYKQAETESVFEKFQKNA